MSNRRSYRSHRTYDVENDASSVNTEHRQTFRTNFETSDNKDVSPSSGKRNSLTSETLSQKSFRTKTVESEKDARPSFSYRKNAASSYHEDEMERKNSDSSRRSSYRSSNYSYHQESEFEVETPPVRDPKEEAAAILAELV